MELLKLTQQFIAAMNLSNSTLEKKQVLKKYPSLQELLSWVYDPFKQYNVTSANCKKKNELRNDAYASTDEASLFKLLDDLTKRVITGHKAIGAVNSFITANQEYEAVIYNIIDKDLKCRVQSKVINSVYPKLIPVFDVALAYDISKFKGNACDGTYYASHKLDGLRCDIVVHPNGIIETYSRTGKLFKTLGVLEDAIRSLNVTSVVFDGEACIVDEDGVENFQAILSEYNKKGHTIKNPRYNIFDVIPYDHFFSGFSPLKMLARQENLRAILSNSSSPHLAQLDQIQVTSEEQLKAMDELAAKNGWEGLILRKNVPYKSGRSFDLLKKKHFYDVEALITGYAMAPMRIIVDEKEVLEEMLSAVVIDYKGYKVSVGSGFSLSERREYYKNPEVLIGKTITVKYFEETTDKSGAISLRFPTKKAIYDGERDV